MSCMSPGARPSGGRNLYRWTGRRDDGVPTMGSVRCESAAILAERMCDNGATDVRIYADRGTRLVGGVRRHSVTGEPTWWADEH